MLSDIVIIIIGIYIVLKGAGLLTEGAVSLAQRMDMPKMLIGLTVVAVGTSMPEFFVSVTFALQGTTTVSPMVISRSTVRRDIPVAILASFVLLGFGIYGGIPRWAGVLFLALLVVYTLFAIRTATPDENSETVMKSYTLTGAIGRVVIGLAGLVVGSDCFVSSATDVAAMLGVSEAVIGLTIVAGGTSLPELATSVVAARKGQSAIAMGNVIGSCVYNILLIIGVTGVIAPMTINGLTIVDFSMMMVSIALLWLFSFTRYKIERWEGWLMIAIFACYLTWLIASI